MENFGGTQYAKPMTYQITEEARERCTQRAKRKAQRGLARSSLKNVLGEIIDELRKEGPPDWFTQEQDIAWTDELDGQRRRIVGRRR